MRILPGLVQSWGVVWKGSTKDRRNDHDSRKAESEENLVTRMYNVGELADLDYGDFPVLFNGSVPRKDVAQNDAARAGRCGLLFGALAATGCREKTGGR